MKKRRLYLLFFVFIAALLLIATDLYTIKVISAIRSYNNGESEYSKGQKGASLYLITYLQTEKPTYWQLFNESIKIPMGGNVATTALINEDDFEIVKNGLLAGKSNPRDVDDMIWFFETFQTTAFGKQCTSILKSTEPMINELNSIGREVHQQIKSGESTNEKKRIYSERISALSASISLRGTAFSSALNGAERNIKLYLVYANIFFIILMLGNITLYAMMMINQLRMSEIALQKKNRELNETNKELEQFTYIASHDLQEPLRMITGFLDLLKMKYEAILDEQAIRYINFATDGAQRMKTLISDLLEYSKTGIKSLEYEQVDLNEIASDTKNIFEHSLAETQGILHIGSLPKIKANKRQLLQLFQNLTGNALKYKSKLPPEIFISSSETSTHWLFSIKDNGLGIAPEFLEKVFVIFQRLQSRSTHSGTGIGLAICKKIIERHNGKIWIESEPGKGSTFFFTIAKNL